MKITRKISCDAVYARWQLTAVKKSIKDRYDL